MIGPLYSPATLKSSVVQAAFATSVFHVGALAAGDYLARIMRGRLANVA
jgi:hypothetical protein